MCVLSQASRQIKEWCPAFKEESMTDWLLWFISKNSADITYYSFSRFEESKKGADWIWCFRVSGHYYLFYIQAKKLKKKDDQNHRGINHSNKNGRQIELLIENAQKEHMFPLYAFYTDAHLKTACKGPYTNEGVFLAPAHLIKDLDDKHSVVKPMTTQENILRSCIGLSCFERCPLLCGIYPEKTGFEDFLCTYFYEGDQSEMPFRLTENDLPGYLSELVHDERLKGHENPQVPEHYMREYASKFEGILHDVQGIVISDLHIEKGWF